MIWPWKLPLCVHLDLSTLFFFYKHLVYKHAQPQILGKFKHIAKHAPGWDFQFEKNSWRFYENLLIFIHFGWNFTKINGNFDRIWNHLRYQSVSIFRILILKKIIKFLITFKNTIVNMNLLLIWIYCCNKGHLKRKIWHDNK